MINWITVYDSSRIVAMAYDSNSETIYVRFPNGVEWWYGNCPKSVWEEFSLPGTSKGKYIHQVLDKHPNGKHS